MNRYKKFANEHHEDIGMASTNSHSRHGLSRATARLKRAHNRHAKRLEAKEAFELVHVELDEFDF